VSDSDHSGPRPWADCDTSSEAWRAYCEAWSHVFTKKAPGIRTLIEDRRGKEGLAMLDHNIAIVKAEYRGEVDDRQELPRLLQLSPQVRTLQQPVKRR
jgi:hypothetical protein